ncbi:hypothetical protein ACKLNO_05050 [Neisseriaceae bacterium B1]
MSKRLSGSYSRKSSLWEHAKPFRQMVYAAMMLGGLFLLSFMDVQTNAQANNTHQANNNPPTPPSIFNTQPPPTGGTHKSQAHSQPCNQATCCKIISTNFHWHKKP